MKLNSLFLGVFICLGNLLQAQLNSTVHDKEIESLIDKMTIEEKVGQMTQITLDVITKGEDIYSSYEPFELDQDSLNKALVDYHIGSVLNTANNRALKPQKWYSLISQIQETALKDRLEIPVLYGVDMIHGATYTVGATMFPQQIGQAATRNRDLVRRGAEVTAYETRASSISWNFSPVLDLGMDPRFPRIWESFGEDPYLISELGVEMINGYEGEDNDLSNPEHVASSLKHFLGYHAATSGKDRTPSYIPTSALREYHLPAFKAAVEAGAHTVMVNSGIINGIPVHANKNLLTGLLKNELNFKGIVVTDWADIENLNRRDRIAKDDKEAVMMAINAGIDMSMVPYKYEVFYNSLVELVNEGKVKEERINDAVRRILRVKFALNLFEHPTTNPKDYPEFGSEAFEKAAYHTAAESITLLKNEEHILPLKKNTKILVTGPNANTMRTLNGAWTYSWQGEKTPEYAQEYNTIFEALQQKGKKNNITYVPGVSYKMDGKYYEQAPDQLEKAVAEAKKADVVILCLGENTYTEKPGDLNDLYLNEHQIALAKKVAATGTPVILVLNEGRPRIISQIEPAMQAVVQTYLPGNFGGDALADILYGEVNPSGKLPYTYPRYPNATIGYIHKPSEEQKKAEGVYNYEADYNPQYRFGDGLSYTSFSYSDLKINKTEIGAGEDLEISVKVTNTGNRKGKEVVELYTSDLYASKITPDVKRLRRFTKIELAPKESKTINFIISTDDLKYADNHGESILEPGEFKILVKDLEESFFVK